MRWLALAMLLFSGCTAPPPPESRLPVLRIAGAESVMDQLMPMLTDTHRRTVGSLEFELVQSDSGDGFRQLLEGEVQLAATTREHLPAEQEQAAANGYSFEIDGARHIVAVDVVAVSVHPANPVDALTYDQIIGIFCTGTIDNWSFLGQEERPIRVVSLEPLSGTRALFEDFFCGPKGMQPHTEVLAMHDIRDVMEADQSAITFVSQTEVAGKVVGLRPDAHGTAMLPSQQNIIRGAYPLYHDLYLYTPGPPVGPAAEFLVWIASPAGQEVVDEARFVPLFLRPDRLDSPRPLRETIHFEPESSTPNPHSMTRLGTLVHELKERSGEVRHVILEGYTDNREPNSLELSKSRAEAVKVLLEAELPGLFFEIIPRGSSNPIAPNETPYGRLRNRRVQIYFAEEELGTPEKDVEVLEGHEG